MSFTPSQKKIGSLSLFLLFSTLSMSNAFAVNGRGGNRWGPLSHKATSGDIGENVKTVDILSLDSIRSSLIRQEETIIFALIERAQYFNNNQVYEKGAMGKFADQEDDESISFMEYMLLGTEALHCKVRRYTSPEEYAFFPERLPDVFSDLPSLEFPDDLLSTKGGASTFNFNSVLLKRYISEIVPAITKRGDDEQYGSAVMADLAVLQAMSRRVHYGKFVAESKYRDNPEGYQALVEAGDTEGVWELLTNMVVEKKVLRRARLKAATYGREPLLSTLPEIEGTDNTSIVAAAAAAAVVAAIEAMGDDDDEEMRKINPKLIESIYEDVIIPLTKDIEVAYLFLRCGKEIPSHLSPKLMSDLIWE